MASNLSKRLDRLEKLAAQLLEGDDAPIYLREGSALPEGVNPERVVWIRRVLVEAPKRAEERPLTPHPSAERTAEPINTRFDRPIPYPRLGLI